MKLQSIFRGIVLSGVSIAYVTSANSFTEALTQGKANGDIRIRYETVQQDNALEDANALTLRTRIGYKTGELNGFSAFTEFEDVRITAGVDDYSVPPTGFQTGEFSVVADPEVTELDQGFLQYSNGSFTAKVGRQVMVFDNHRFIGHVGWRQDRQTFDGASFNLKPNKNLSLNYNYINKRNRIFAEAADQDSNDHLLHAAYKTPIGTITGYAYLLEQDNALDTTYDTFGLRFNGQNGKWSYIAELASQSFEAGTIEADANYIMAELGYNFGPVTVKGSYELLGSDNGNYGFSTPLATLHKFNGWADLFLATPTQGLEDTAISIGGKLFQGAWIIRYHNFSTDESAPNDDLGDEVDFEYKRKFAKHYNFGLRAAFYSDADGPGGRVDTDKVWFWVGASF